MKAILRALAIAALVVPFSIHAADALSEGTVKKVEAAAGRVTLAHGPIENIGMPPMTMMFKVKDPAMLKKVKEGDKVRFRVEEIGGTYTVVRIEAAK
ncbi:copper-binding protein [Sulfurisoma sediminicola]|jgi:Cu(I)/Ag(I) efflux system periplasmic protein CusF|uniref:Cu/Ag efflux protein CusF n=1 Tax=Sulfurisoma sediminicola TaxID=1381557 RepID=A0A497XKP1_9PROT|nr:copper-binding protein [Sulfurisoma sediminicola]RLJ68511.1 Cu/Ag efflux protein CusF [Sulfurisoma sediminicola]